LIVRCGYLHSHFVRESTTDQKKIESAVQLEKKAFTSADLCTVTSQWQKDLVVENYNIDRQKVKVIPNYVITNIFKPDLSSTKKFDLVYVGRSHKQKNLENLFKAVNYLRKKNKRLSLLLIGDSYKNKKLREMTVLYNLNVTFKDNIPNFKLPLFLNKSRIFILPSKYEGHPKSLIEAMSCGLPCIGSNVVGIKEDIAHTENGYLCGTDYTSIADALDSVTSDKSLSKKMGEKAREYVLNNYSLDKILNKELEAIREVIEK
jgi:glycosyltransferase involved in cell wall biosynthesis